MLHKKKKSFYLFSKSFEQCWRKVSLTITSITRLNYIFNWQILHGQQSTGVACIRSTCACIKRGKMSAVLEIYCLLTPAEYALFLYSQVKLYLVSIISRCVLSPHPLVTSSVSSSCFNSDSTGMLKNLCTPTAQCTVNVDV